MVHVVRIAFTEALASRKRSWCVRRAVLALAALLTALSGAAAPTTYQLDAQGRLGRAIYPDGTVVDYTYDNNGNRTAATITHPPNSPPTAPTNLTATAVSPSQINLGWLASTDDAGVSGYKIERCQGVSCSNFALVTTVTSLSFPNSGLAASTTYRYRVRAYDAADLESPNSNIASATTHTPPDVTAPSVPTGLTATATGPNQVSLSWSPSTDTGGAGLAGYHIYRGGAQLGTSASASYVDNTVTGGTAYSYQVDAYDAASPANVSAQSSAASVTTPLAPPASITGPEENFTGAYTISWSASSGATRYELWEGKWGVSFVKQYDGPATSMAFSGKTTAEYAYKAKACNATTCSDYSPTHLVRVCRPQCLSPDVATEGTRDGTRGSR